MVATAPALGSPPRTRVGRIRWCRNGSPRSSAHPTEPQIEGWPSILRGDPTLISAPTGSGKTLTAFPRLHRHSCCVPRLKVDLEPRTQVVYISPLKALSNDIQKNLDGAPARDTAARRPARLPVPRHPHRRAHRRHAREGARVDAASIRRTSWSTTPESLYILLTAGKPRHNLTHVQTVIVDEIHADRGRQSAARIWRSRSSAWDALGLRYENRLIARRDAYRASASRRSASACPQRRTPSNSSRASWTGGPRPPSMATLNTASFPEQ